MNSMQQKKITDDLQALLDVLPPEIAGAVKKADDSDNLLEVILDLGRLPTARFVEREVVEREYVEFIVSLEVEGDFS